VWNTSGGEVVNMIRRKLSSRNAFLIGIVSLVLVVLIQASAVLFEVVAMDAGWTLIMTIALGWCAVFLPFGYVMRSDDSGTRIGWFLLLIGLLMMPSALILHGSLRSISLAWSVLTASLALDAIFIVLAGFLVFVYQRSRRMQLEGQSVSTTT
jgi:hypothetical protein